MSHDFWTTFRIANQMGCTTRMHNDLSQNALVIKCSSKVARSCRMQWHTIAKSTRRKKQFDGLHPPKEHYHLTSYSSKTKKFRPIHVSRANHEQKSLLTTAKGISFWTTVCNFWYFFSLWRLHGQRNPWRVQISSVCKLCTLCFAFSQLHTHLFASFRITAVESKKVFWTLQDSATLKYSATCGAASITLSTALIILAAFLKNVL